MRLTLALLMAAVLMLETASAQLYFNLRTRDHRPPEVIQQEIQEMLRRPGREYITAPTTEEMILRELRMMREDRERGPLPTIEEELRRPY